jgi:hypothetical protein
MGIGNKFSPRNYVELEHKGYTVVNAGDDKMEKLAKLQKYFIIKQFDTETWYISTPDWYAEHRKELENHESGIFKEISAKAKY